VILSEKTISTVIFILKSVYISLSIFVVLLILLTHELGLISYSIVGLIIFYGLHKVKLWVIPIIIFLNFLGVIRLFYHFFMFSNYSQLAPFPVRLVFLCFPILVIFFLTKKEVRAYFKEGK